MLQFLLRQRTPGTLLNTRGFPVQFFRFSVLETLTSLISLETLFSLILLVSRWLCRTSYRFSHIPCAPFYTERKQHLLFIFSTSVLVWSGAVKNIDIVLHTAFSRVQNYVIFGSLGWFSVIVGSVRMIFGNVRICFNILHFDFTKAVLPTANVEMFWNKKLRRVMSWHSFGIDTKTSSNLSRKSSKISRHVLEMYENVCLTFRKSSENLREIFGNDR